MMRLSVVQLIRKSAPVWSGLVMVVLGLLLMSMPSHAQGSASPTPTEELRLCQTYHVRGSYPKNVYQTTDESSRVIGRVQPNVNVCVVGIAETNGDFYEINPDPDALETVIGYIPTNDLRVGEPGTTVIYPSEAYCDLWEVRSTRINVRQCGSTGCAVVDNRVEGDRVCVMDYSFSGGNWSQIQSPADGSIGWVSSSLLSYSYNEASGCPDNSHILVGNADVYSCTDLSCATGIVAPAGAVVCVLTDSYEGATWVRFHEGSQEDPVGWIRIDLLNPVEIIPESDTVSLTQDVNFADTTAEPQAPPTITPTPTLVPVQNGVVVAQVASPSPTATILSSVDSTAQAATQASLPQICPVGASPIVEGECVTVTPPAQVVTPQPGNGIRLAQTLSFPSLFIDNIELTSPQGVVDYTFSIPRDWDVTGPVTLSLDLDYSESISTINNNTDLVNLTSRLDIRLDGILASTVTLSRRDVGRRQIEVILPTQILSDRSNRFHTLTLELSARDHCEVNSETRVNINAQSSFMRVVYEETLPILELSAYPAPFYNSPIGNEQESVTFVLPNQAEDVHYQMAASIAAGFGRLTGNTLLLNAVFASQVTDEMYRNQNLILVGEPTRNALTSELYQRNALPTRLDPEGQILLNGTLVEPNSGVLQLIPNPQNPNRAIMVVTATGSLGLQRAGQALGGPPALIGLSSNVAIVTDSTPRFHTDPQLRDLPLGTYSFESFGVTENVVLLGNGLSRFSFEFDVPVGGDLREDAYIELLFNATNAVNLNSSSLNVLLNEVPISGVTLSDILDESSLLSGEVDREVIEVDFTRLRINIPQGVIIPGQRNQLAFLVDMNGDWGCDLPNFLWTSISKDSTLFLPQEPLGDAYFPLVSQLPVPFNSLPNLSDVWVSLPEAVTSVELGQLLRLMSLLGRSNPLVEGVLPTIQMGDLPPSTDLSKYNFIVLGRPSESAFIASINDTLPQPFGIDDNSLLQEYDDISYRIDPTVDLGVLQIQQSPWNPQHAIFVISGTTPAGQDYAANALFNLAFGRQALNGNIVFVSRFEANAIDTRYVFNEREILEQVPILAGIADEIQQPPTATPREVIIPTSTLQPEATTNFTAVPTLIFTLAPQEITSTPRPTLAPLPTVTQETPGNNSSMLYIVIGGLVIAILVMLASMFLRRGGTTAS